jgi:hypothetical protein
LSGSVVAIESTEQQIGGRRAEAADILYDQGDSGVEKVDERNIVKADQRNR